MNQFAPLSFAIRAAALGVLSVSLVAAATVAAATPSTASAIFQPVDTTTQGNWPGMYGQDGYIIANGASNPPSYATVNISGSSAWTWLASTSDTRALYTSPTGSATNRLASVYFSGSSFTIDLTLTGGAHQVALYLLDLDTTQRSETIAILDPSNNNAVLDTRSFSGFHNGEWAVWILQGHVQIQVTNTGGLNAVVSGLFFGQPPTQLPTATITAPLGLITVSGHAVTVAATAAATLPAAVSSVQFQLDGANLGNPVTASPYTTSWDSTTAKNGSHTLTAVVTDTLGQHGTSAPVTVTSSNGGTPPPTVSINSPTGGATVSSTTAVTASVSSSALPVSVQFQLDNVNLGAPVTAAPYSITWDTTAATNTTHALTAIATDNLAQSTTSAPVSVTVANSGSPAPGATFVKTDTTTIGNWVGAYGQNGALIANDSLVNPPSYATVTTAAPQYTWNVSTADPRALYSSSSAGGRIASTYYSASNTGAVFSFDVNLVDGNTHQVAVYAVDFENLGRAETVSILNANTNAVLDSRSISNFSGGVYLVWNLTGHVIISITNTGSLNAVVSGLFFGLPPTTAPTVTITSPLSGTSIIIGNAITITASAAATLPAIVSSVQFQIDGGNLGSPVISPPYTISWDGTNYKSGPHTLTAVVTDSLGQHGTSTSITVTTANAGQPAPPSVSITAPTSGATVSGSTTTVTATVSSTAPSVSVQFLLDNVNLGTSVTAAPYSVKWDTTTASSGAHSLTAIATDSLNQSTTSSPVSVTVSNGGGGSISPFLTAYTKTTPRTDYSGFVGTILTVAAQNLYVQSLGRICISGNSGTHTIKLVNTASGADVSGASASVSMAGCTVGQFVYTNLPSTITLISGASYYLVSQETLGGDSWYDVAQVTGSPDATVKGAVYSYNGAWIANGSGSLSYVPANFQYSTTAGGGGNPAPPTVSVTNPANNATVSGTVAITASATANSPATVASVQFQVDGSNLGAAVTNSPYSISWDTTTVTKGPHILSATVKDSTGQTGNSGSVSVLVNNTTGGGSSTGSPLLTSYSATFANLRNDFSGFVGMSFTVNQGSPILVSALGRICVAGNNGSHVVKLVSAVGLQDVSGASATVSMAGCAAGQFVYANLPNAIQLPAGGVYYLASQEVNGGDTWYDAAGVNASGATVNGAVYFFNGSWVFYNTSPSAYVPPNLKFAVAGASGAPPTVSVTSPAAGGTVSGTAVAVTASAVASAPSTAASVTFYLDGVTLGTAAAAAGFSINWDTTQTNNGPHTLIAVALDSAGLTTVSTAVVVTVNNGGSSSGGTPFVTTFGFYNPTLRNNFSGFAGLQLTVTAATPLAVSSVGRACAQSDSGTHTVKFADQVSGLDIPGASAVVNMSGCTPGQFVWAALPAPIFLSPGVNYYLVSEEFAGGDLFYEKGPITTAPSVAATVISAVYLQTNGVWHRIAPPNYSYVPPNFK